MSTQTNSSLKKIRVGILGFGTVGQGTRKHLQENAHLRPKNFRGLSLSHPELGPFVGQGASGGNW